MAYFLGETLKLPIAKTETFYRPPWFQAAAEEFQATREAVSLCDYSSFAKMDLWSSGREVVSHQPIRAHYSIALTNQSIVFHCTDQSKHNILMH